MYLGQIIIDSRDKRKCENQVKQIIQQLHKKLDLENFEKLTAILVTKAGACSHLLDSGREESWLHAVLPDACKGNTSLAQLPDVLVELLRADIPEEQQEETAKQHKSSSSASQMASKKKKRGLSDNKEVPRTNTAALVERQQKDKQTGKEQGKTCLKQFSSNTKCKKKDFFPQGKFACVECIRKKRKCTRGIPTCLRCKKLRLECRYITKKKTPGGNKGGGKKNSSFGTQPQQSALSSLSQPSPNKIRCTRHFV
uniref:Zn(2)-C6 fungal-type domain-containing protein n=1 Tax=Heterosigma akashiwo TaxID=2829 RepID=A0A7S4D5Z5_HETAK